MPYEYGDVAAGVCVFIVKLENADFIKVCDHQNELQNSIRYACVHVCLCVCVCLSVCAKWGLFRLQTTQPTWNYIK